MTIRMHHFEVYVTVEDGVIDDVEVNGENSATWPDGTVCCGDVGWLGPDEIDTGIDEQACAHLERVLERGQAPDVLVLGEEELGRIELLYRACCDGETAEISPEDIGDIGTPICGACGEDLEIHGAKVRVR